VVVKGVHRDEETLGEVTIQEGVDSSSKKTLCQPPQVALTSTAARGKLKKQAG